MSSESDQAPSPSSPSSSSSSSSSSGNGSNKAPPPEDSASSSNGASSSSPTPPSSQSSDSGGGLRSPSQGSSSPSPPPPSGSSSESHSSPPPAPPQSSSSSSSSSSSGGGSNSSPEAPTPPSESSGNGGGGGRSSPPPNWSSPPQQQQQSGGSTPSPPSPSSSQPPPSSGSSASSSEPSQPRSSPPPSPPQSSGSNGQPPKPSGGQQAPPQSPPAPANQSVVYIPVPVASNSPPGMLPPPQVIDVTPSGAISSTNFPGSTQGRSNTTGGSVQQHGSNTSTSQQHASLSSTQASSSGHIAAAIAGAAVTGLLCAIVAIYLIVSSRRKKKMDGLVYHYDGNNYFVPSSQFGGSSHHPPSGIILNSGGPSADGGGYYNSGSFSGGEGTAPAGSKSRFSYEELTGITSNFSRDNVIGEGGFGCVYKGWLSDGKCVAVKQLKAGSGQGEREFQAEVEIISRVHHRHLVSLVGYCIAAHHRMLIYEFVPNGTLEHHLHGRGVPVMDWPTRLRIAIGAAKGLAYLHEDCHPRIIHRDIKTANILLDYSWEAQVADFGLAKLANDAHTHVSTRIMGTFGYLAPEYASSGKLTDRSDVFSFGVVLLELITGRKPVDQTQPLGEESLVEWARPVLADAVETGDLSELVDRRLEGAYNRSEMMTMVEAAAACVRHSAPKRPRMVQVMRVLDEGSMTDLSNGIKVGQSQVFAGGSDVADIQQLRRTAFASEEFTGEFEHNTASSNSESRPMNRIPE